MSSSPLIGVYKLISTSVFFYWLSWQTHSFPPLASRVQSSLGMYKMCIWRDRPRSVCALCLRFPPTETVDRKVRIVKISLQTVGNISQLDRWTCYMIFRPLQSLIPKLNIQIHWKKYFGNPYYGNVKKMSSIIYRLTGFTGIDICQTFSHRMELYNYIIENHNPLYFH